MSNITANQPDANGLTLETLRQIIRRLPGEQRQQLRTMLAEDAPVERERQLDLASLPAIPPAEFAAKWEQERTWLAQHQHEYAGQWVALDGDRLITFGDSAKDVYAALKAAGISGTLVTRVEHADDLTAIE
ncbi:MAG: hypothetical protein HYR56_04400 [Acidobacteria bacterium]|nr:hypothetical protein [Acidobacteriota bacterium]MBI3421725.1 hypothetical protein [Acidobacteriota bacterium]